MSDDGTSRDLDERVDAALTRYASLMLGERHRALTRRTLLWSGGRETASGLEQLAKEAFLSSTFEVLCAPPGATFEESFLSMKFLLLFFRADDAPPSLLDDFVTSLDEPSERPSGDLGAYCDSLLADLRELQRDSSGFRAALRDMCVAMQTERRVDKATVTVDEYRRLRKHTVAVPSYTECWRAILGVVFSPSLAAVLEREKLCDLAAEIVYLVNDLGSLERDERTARDDPDSLDLNLVLLRSRTTGDRDAALADVLRRENELIAEFRAKERQLLRSPHAAEPALQRYLGVLRATINGNLATMKHLVPVRYPGAEVILERVHEV